MNASERCLKHTRLADTHRDCDQTDRQIGGSRPAAFEAQGTRSGRHLKATQHQRKATRPQAGEIALEGHRGRWVSINQEGKESRSKQREPPAEISRARAEGLLGRNSDGRWDQKTQLGGWQSRKEAASEPCRPPGTSSAPPRRKEPASARRLPRSAETTGVTSRLKRNQEKNVRTGGRRNHTRLLCGSNGRLRFYSLPRPLPDDTQPWKRGRERYTGGETRLLTVGWMPAHGVQVEVAVVEEKLVL